VVTDEPPKGPLTGEAAWRFVEEIRARNARIKAEQLAAGKADGAARGKEPFDLDRLETMCDTSSEGRVAPREWRESYYEDKYYVFYPDVMTLAELAEKVTELSRWS